jgi:hypothetical protein
MSEQNKKTWKVYRFNVVSGVTPETAILGENEILGVFDSEQRATIELNALLRGILLDGGQFQKVTDTAAFILGRDLRPIHFLECILS